MNLQELFERQNMRVYRVAILYLKNAADAEDAVQNVFLKYIEKDITFASESHENAWFITVTRNYCKDVLKAFWRKRVELGEIPETRETDHEQSDLLSQIQTLPAKYREVLYFYYYEEYSIREMASILHRKESTIQTQLAAARKQLRTHLEREGLKYES
jgi:RNA polymerase sigma-70 factor (ECF subfamily)